MFAQVRVFTLRWDFYSEVWFCTVIWATKVSPQPRSASGHMRDFEKSWEPKAKGETWRFCVQSEYDPNSWLSQIISLVTDDKHRGHDREQAWRTSFLKASQENSSWAEPAGQNKTERLLGEQDGSVSAKSFIAAWGSSRWLSGESCCQGFVC